MPRWSDTLNATPSNSSSKSSPNAVHSVASLLILFLAGAALPAAALPSAPGYVVSEVADTEDATGAVLLVGNTLFAGFGAFGAGTQEVVRIDDDGTRTTIADGFNAISGLAYDASSDRLIVGDNGGDQLGALTGDTVFGIADPFGALAASAALGNELLPAGSIPGAADLVLDPNDPNRLFITDSDLRADPIAGGKLWEADLSAGTATQVQQGLGFAAGLAASATELFIGDLDATLFTGSVASVAIATPGAGLSAIASGLGGQFDLELLASGLLLGTAFGDLLLIDPSGGVSVLASGLGFGTGVSEDSGTIYVADGGFAVTGNRIFRLVEVPEPSALVLVGLGLVGVAGWRRRC